MLPHRSEAGKRVEVPGLDVQAALEAKLKGYVLMGVEPSFDIANPALARQSMFAAEFVVSLSAFENESLQDYADVILPMASYAETSGTYVNIDGTWQTMKGAIMPYGESRPGWKILRVLGNVLHCKGFEYQSSEEIRAEVKQAVDRMSVLPYVPFYPDSLPAQHHSLVRIGEWPLYRIDSIVRRAVELQTCAAADVACIRIHPETAQRLQLNETATVSQGDIEITLPLKRDERIAPDAVWVANALPETVDLGHSFASITIKRS
jgi:NADH-quinone oxidoreductase subunit G